MISTDLLGPGVHAGHYTALIKLGDDWWDMNDQIVTKSNHSKALKSKENYMLFYVAKPL